MQWTTGTTDIAFDLLTVGAEEGQTYSCGNEEINAERRILRQNHR